MPLECKFKIKDGTIQVAVYFLYKNGPGKRPMFIISFEQKTGNDFTYKNGRVPANVLEALIEMGIIEYTEPFLKLTTKSLLKIL
jgi:hypothetical protein